MAFLGWTNLHISLMQGKQMYSIHLYEVIFTGRRHKPDSICNKTITGFCICEYEFLIDLQNQYTCISCWWGNHENVFSLLTEEYHIPRGQRRGEYDTRGRLHFHISWTCMLLMFYFTEWNQENTYMYNTAGKHMLNSLERCLKHLKTHSQMFTSNSPESISQTML